MNIVINGEEWTPEDLTELVVRDQQQRGRRGGDEQMSLSATEQVNRPLYELTRDRAEGAEAEMCRMRKERDGMRKERDYARGCFNEQSAALERLERERDGEENLRQEAQRERDAAWNKAGKRKDQRDAWKKAAELAQRVLEAARADTQAAQRECVELKAEIRRRDGVAPETGTDRGSVPTELQPVPVDADPAPIGSWEYAMEKMRGGEKMRFRTWPEAVYVCSMGSYELRGEQYAQSGEHGLHEGWRPTMYEMDRPWWDRWTPPVDEKEDDA